MQSKLIWKEGMFFEGTIGPHLLATDAKAPLGKNQGPNPKEYVLMGISGCTAMDVVALMRKYRQSMESLEVEAQASLTEGSYPVVFKSVELIFRMTGQIDPEKAREAIHLSQTKFCGVSAMISRSVPITWKLEINGLEQGQGEANFPQA